MNGVRRCSRQSRRTRRGRSGDANDEAREAAASPIFKGFFLFRIFTFVGFSYFRENN